MNLLPALKFAALPLLLMVSASGAVFADDHNYQVTGPVLSMTDTSVTVKKGSSPWEVSRDSNTKVTGDLKVGSKVTIMYHMVADSVVVKPAK